MSATTVEQAFEDFEKHILVFVLVLVLFLHVHIWIATRDTTHLLFMALEAVAAGAVLRRLLSRLDPDKPLPPPHFVTTSTYTAIAAYVIAQYAVHSPLDVVHVLWGALLAALLVTPLLP